MSDIARRMLLFSLSNVWGLFLKVTFFRYPRRKNPELTSPTDGLFNGLLCKAVSTSAPFVFIMNLLPNRYLSATDPVSRNRCTKSVIIDAFGAAEKHLSHGNEIL
ncbi:hypothetical protein TNCV_285741 [Trichonephila clavipes]|nr:hypothetical protein TNCV_285741 [Trichonephila clavipes]